ncbi:MAG: CPBP family intramembrane glutamic endopeptidase [Phycisphaerae bacterium]
MSKLSRSQLLNFAPDSYLERTSRPLYSLIFLLPFIVFYELGTIFLNTDVLDRSQVRVVAFVWLQRGLEHLGLGGKFAWIAPPLVVVAILLALHITSKKSWRFFVNDFWPMHIECILLSIPLIVLSLALNTSAGSGIPAQADMLMSGFLGQAEVFVQHSVLADIVTGIGAGIYEELIFRLILICLLMMVLQDLLRFSHRDSVVIAIIVSAALFSAHHHILLINGQFENLSDFSWMVFIFRTVAGVYFAVLFAIRGFGIAAGTHAFYDIIATLINAAFFSQQ